MHLADAFIQNDLQCIQVIHFLSVCVPWELNPQPLHCERKALPLSHRNIHIAPTVARSAIPPWLFPMPLMDIQLHKEKHNNETSVWESLVVHKYIDLTYYSVVQIYTDGSKDPVSGKTAVVSVYIPLFKIKMSKRTSDHISVFTAVLIALLLALEWIEEIQPTKAVICTDCLSALNSLSSLKWLARPDMINEVMQSQFSIRQCGLVVNCVWVPPSHMAGNEEADHLAKQTLNHSQIDIEVILSKTEIKVILVKEVQEIWQNEWKREQKTFTLHTRKSWSRENKIWKQERGRFNSTVYQISAYI